MNSRQKFFRTGVYSVSVPSIPLSNNEEDLLSPTSQDECSIICPLNEHGYVSDVLGRALSDSTSPTLREHLLGLLDDFSTAVSNVSVPDEVKLNLCKLRSCQTPSEMRKYIDALSSWCDSNNVSLPDNESNTNENESNTIENETNLNENVSNSNE